MGSVKKRLLVYKHLICNHAVFTVFLFPISFIFPIFPELSRTIPIFYLLPYSYTSSSFISLKTLIDSSQFSNVPSSYFSNCLLSTIRESQSVVRIGVGSPVISCSSVRQLYSTSSWLLSLNVSLDKVHLSAQIDILKFTLRFIP